MQATAQVPTLPENPVELQAVYVIAQIPARVPRAVRRLLGHVDGVRDLNEVLRRAQISTERGLAIIKKLMADQILERADSADTITLSQHDYTVVEQAFFESEVQPLEPPATFWERLSLRWTEFLLRRQAA